MFEESECDPSDAPDWVIRNEFWNTESRNSAPKRRIRERTSAPLILCGHGVSLRIEHGSLVIRDGFTHYPQKQERHRFFRGSREVPARILLLDGSGTISFDVLSWLGEQGVALARVKSSGDIAVVASGSGFASDQAKVSWQNRVHDDQRKRISFASDLISRKLMRSVETLQHHFPESRLSERAIAYLRAASQRLTHEHFREINEIRALEGECAARYFEVWRELDIVWAGTTRKPIPDDWRQFSSRSSVAKTLTSQNRGASHPVNALLNYAYAVKLAQLQLGAISEGYDPTIGIMHHARRGKPAFALDLIEPERPRVDSAILTLIRSYSLHSGDFVLRHDGVCRLAPQLARKVASAVAELS